MIQLDSYMTKGVNILEITRGENESSSVNGMKSTNLFRSLRSEQ